MANYNTFAVQDCKKRRITMVTSSARKAKKELHVGIKIDVWNENNRIETIYSRQSNCMDKYITLEKQHISEKQKKAEERNKRRRGRHEEIKVQ